MDLKKVLDTINYELIVAKLHAYLFSIAALEILLSYLQERWQIVKINTLVWLVWFLVSCYLTFT